MKKPPVRLLHDPSVAASVRANLQCVREAPGGYDAARGFERLQRELELAGPSGTAPSTPPPTPRGLELSGLGATKALWISGVGALCIVAAGALVTGLPRGRQSLPGGAPAPPSPAAARESSAPPLPAAPLRLDPATALAPSGTAVSPGVAARREIEQLIQIRALLRRDAAAAYELAQRSAREFPRGALREEREALTALALSRIGEHARAQEQARAFLQSYPNSPLRAVVQRLLGEDVP